MIIFLENREQLSREIQANFEEANDLVIFYIFILSLLISC